MPVNTAVLTLVLIFIPGILCYGVVAALASKRARDNTTILLQIFMYGVASYMALALLDALLPSVAAWLGTGLDGFALLNPATVEKSGIKTAPIAAASMVGIVLGILITYNVNRGLLIRLCRAVGITTRFGDPDVWSWLLNSGDTDNWVTVRHKEREHIYQGYVSSFSGGDMERELVLTDVIVYDLSTAVEVGRIPVLYLAFKKNDLVLEFNEKSPAGGNA